MRLPQPASDLRCCESNMSFSGTLRLRSRLAELSPIFLLSVIVTAARAKANDRLPQHAVKVGDPLKMVAVFYSILTLLRLEQSRTIFPHSLKASVGIDGLIAATACIQPMKQGSRHRHSHPTLQTRCRFFPSKRTSQQTYAVTEAQTHGRLLRPENQRQSIKVGDSSFLEEARTVFLGKETCTCLMWQTS